jgi:hypothetical protein
MRRAVALFTVLLAGCASAAVFTAPAYETMAACLDRSSIGCCPPPRPPSSYGTRSRMITPSTRAQANTLYPNFQYPVDVGRISGGRVACFLGGVFVGRQPRGLTWEAVKAVGGVAVRLQQAGRANVNGLQVDNLRDGIDLRSAVPSNPASGDGWVFRNSYMTYIRDDCILTTCLPD